ncbi:hypothetical protein GCM10009425_03460 [Pseudomonas asuensis]|uniref:Uncharacterized protein n=1 Tax=Pseudomonas asuensis TaxID=1825787 RepID=A0ABQ2GGU1_9PSED|nr:hypothetical protein GCM10009425_03460 [Pseudomonas asuensis]
MARLPHAQNNNASLAFEHQLAGFDEALVYTPTQFVHGVHFIADGTICGFNEICSVGHLSTSLLGSGLIENAEL